MFYLIISILIFLQIFFHAVLKVIMLKTLTLLDLNTLGKKQLKT